MAIERRDLFKGLLALLAGALLPKPLLAQRVKQGILNPGEREWNDFRIVRTVPFNEPPSDYVTVTERWARGEHSFRIEDGPWISIPPQGPCPWIFFDSRIHSVERTEWMEPHAARLLAAQTSAPKYIIADTGLMELTDVLKR